MPEDEKRRDRELAELAALADGSLPLERRKALEQRVEGSPRLQALLRSQQEALEAVRALDQRAPGHLHETISTIRPRRHRARGALIAVGATGLAAMAILIGLVLPSSEPASPTLAQAAALAARAPAAGGLAGGERAWGLEYPDLKGEHGWNDAGSRTDRLGNRDARTVFYVKGGRRLAYTIISTGLVRVQRGTRTWIRKGRPWYSFDQDGRTVVAWEREGHMCVVSANGLRSRPLVELITR
jgi:anti-sigma factor RsiW